MDHVRQYANIEIWSDEEKSKLKYISRNGEEVNWVKTTNPHSGVFVLNKKQVEYLRNQKWPPKEFIGPLETAATGTVLDHFDVLKTDHNNRRFLCIKHGNPSFLGYMDKWDIIERKPANHN